MYAVKYTQM